MEYFKGDSRNLPKLDVFTLMEFFNNHSSFHASELRGTKAMRSARESYGDNAIGRVEVGRLNSLCFIKGEVTPEHKVRQAGYKVTVTIDENKEEIVDGACEDCQGAAGGCKHLISFLFWIHRRSEEPAPTDVVCYWKKPLLSKVGSSVRSIKAVDIGGTIPSEGPAIDGQLCTQEIFDEMRKRKISNQISPYIQDVDNVSDIVLHKSIFKFKEAQGFCDPELFRSFLTTLMTSQECLKILKNTVLQSESKLWHEVRFGRVTASKIHEATRCQSIDGSLVEAILGARKLKDNIHLERGRELENVVLKEVEKTLKMKITKCGIYLNKEWPVVGASPDGINEHAIFEVKCPSSEKANVTYLKLGQITPKFMNQMQIQMHFSCRLKGYFCVAAHDFETSKKVQIVEVDYNRDQCLEILKEATSFWDRAIFPILFKMN